MNKTTKKKSYEKNNRNKWPKRIGDKLVKDERTGWIQSKEMVVRWSNTFWYERREIGAAALLRWLILAIGGLGCAGGAAASVLKVGRWSTSLRRAMEQVAR